MAQAAEPTRKPTAAQQEAWDYVRTFGTQAAAAAKLGITQGGVQSRLRGYMDRMGIKGPMPGLIASPTSITSLSHTADTGAAVITIPIERTTREDDETNAPTGAQIPDLEIEPTEAEQAPEDAGGMTPPAPFTHWFAPLRADDQDPDPVDHLHPMVRGALTFLAERGPAWSQQQADRWADAFHAAVELVYPAAD